MNKVTIILGPRGSGKTTECERRCKRKTATWYDVGDDALILRREGYKPLSEIIVLEDVAEAAWPAMLEFICKSTIGVSPALGPVLEIDRPEVILTSRMLSLPG